MANGTDLKIEKGIPLPEGTRGSGGITAVLRSMTIGDSVLLSNCKYPSGYAALALGKGNYACRKEGTGFRIWRVK